MHGSLQTDFKSVIKINDTDNHSANRINCTVVINMKKDMFCVNMGYLGIIVKFTLVINMGKDMFVYIRGIWGS